MILKLLALLPVSDSWKANFYFLSVWLLEAHNTHVLSFNLLSSLRRSDYEDRIFWILYTHFITTLPDQKHEEFMINQILVNASGLYDLVFNKFSKNQIYNTQSALRHA